MIHFFIGLLFSLSFELLSKHISGCDALLVVQVTSLFSSQRESRRLWLISHHLHHFLLDSILSVLYQETIHRLEWITRHCHRRLHFIPHLIRQRLQRVTPISRLLQDLSVLLQERLFSRQALSFKDPNSRVQIRFKQLSVMLLRHHLNQLQMHKPTFRNLSVWSVVISPLVDTTMLSLVRAVKVRLATEGYLELPVTLFFSTFAGFFRRTVLTSVKNPKYFHYTNNIPNIYKCNDGKHTCPISADKSRRRCCKSCRYQRCVLNGMNYDAFLYTESSNA